MALWGVPATVSLSVRFQGRTKQLLQELVRADLYDALWNNICSTRKGNRIAITLDLDKPVPDVQRYVYTRHKPLQISTTDWLDFQGSQIPVGMPIQETPVSILLLMESPHKDEVSCCLDPLCPAAGETGYRIQASLERLRHLLDDLWPYLASPPKQKVPVVLANPVRFPASCRVGRKWGYWRHLVYERLVLKSPLIRKSFRERRNAYHPVIILNACTHRTGAEKQPPVSTRYSRTPKQWVASMLKYWLRQRSVLELEYRKGSNSFEQKNAAKKPFPRTGQKYDVIVVDLPHPSTWWRK